MAHHPSRRPISYQNDPVSFINDPMISKFLGFAKEHRRQVEAEQRRVDEWEQRLQTDPVYSASAYDPPSNVSHRKDPIANSVPIATREVPAWHDHDQYVSANPDVPVRRVAGSALRFGGSHPAGDASRAWGLGEIMKETRQDEESEPRRDRTKKRRREDGIGEGSAVAVRGDESGLQGAEGACSFPWKKQRMAYEQAYVRTLEGKIKSQPDPRSQTWQFQQNGKGDRPDVLRPRGEWEYTPNRSAAVAPRLQPASTMNATPTTPLPEHPGNCGRTSSVGAGGWHERFDEEADGYFSMSETEYDSQCDEYCCCEK